MRLIRIVVIGGLIIVGVTVAGLLGHLHMVTPLQMDLGDITLPIHIVKAVEPTAGLIVTVYGCMVSD